MDSGDKIPSQTVRNKLLSDFFIIYYKIYSGNYIDNLYYFYEDL